MAKDSNKELKEAREKLALAQKTKAASEEELQKKKDLLKVLEKEAEEAEVVLSINKENVKIVDQLRQKRLELAVLGKKLTEEEDKKLDIAEKNIAADEKYVKIAEEKLKLIEDQNKEIDKSNKDLEKTNKELETSKENLKEILRSRIEQRKLEKESLESISDYNSELTSIGNTLGKQHKLYKAIQTRQDSINTAVQSVASQIRAMPADQGKLKASAEQALKVYKDSETSVAAALKDLAQQKITQQEFNSVAQKSNDSLQEALSYIDRSTAAGNILYNTLKNAGKVTEQFAKSAKKSEQSFSSFSAAFDQFSGIPVMSELNTLIKTNIKDTLAFKAAVFALGAALGKAAYDYFGAPIKAGMQADKERKQNAIDTERNIAKLKKDAEFIPAQIAQEKREAEIQGTLQIARAMQEASMAGVRAAHEFKQSMKQGAAQFERAAKTALFGKGIGSIGYNAAQMQLAGVGADKVAAAMEAAASATGKMPSGKVGADMALMAERTGQSVDNIAQINEYFQRTDKVSASTAMNMQEGLRAMADQAGIGLGNLMREVAEASKDALSYQIKSGPALAKAVTYAQSLGVNFGDIAKAGKSMVLNYKDSIKAEMQLSTLLGKQVDLSEVRAKFAAGDTTGALEALKAQGLDPAEMDMFQQEALSQSLGGMDLQSLSKIATNKGAKPGELKAGDAKKGGQEFLDRTQKAESQLSAAQAKISAESAVFDAKLSAAMEQAFIGSDAYKKSKEAQNQLAQDAEALAGSMNDAWLATDAYKKSLVDTMKLDFVSGIKENLMSGLAMLGGGLMASMTRGIGSAATGAFKLVGKLGKGTLSLTNKAIKGIGAKIKSRKEAKAAKKAASTDITTEAKNEPKKLGLFGKIKAARAKRREAKAAKKAASTDITTEAKPSKLKAGFAKVKSLFSRKKQSDDITAEAKPTDEKGGLFTKIKSLFGGGATEAAEPAAALAEDGGALFSKSNPGYVIVLGGELAAATGGESIAEAATGEEGGEEPKSFTDKIKDNISGKLEGLKESLTEKAGSMVSGLGDKLKGSKLGKKFSGITSMFGGGGEAEGGEGAEVAAGSVEALGGAASDAAPAGEALETLGGVPPTIGATLQSIAIGLQAFKPPVLMGAGVLAGAIVIIGAGIAGAAWILGKALPTLAEGLTAFNTVDGGNLVSVGLGITALGVGMAAMGAGAVIGGIGNLVGSLFGGGIDDTIKKVEKFSEANINAKKVEENANAIVAYSKAMAASGLGSAAAGIGNLVGGIANGIAGFFKVKPPLDQMQEFAKHDFGSNAEKIKGNAEVFAAFGNAMSSFQGSSGGLSGVLGDALAGFFKLKPPIEQMKEFAKEDFSKDKEKIKGNAEAFTAFGNAMASYKGSTGGLMEVLAQGIANYFKVPSPIDKFTEFANLPAFDKEKVKNNAEAFTAFGNAMSSYQGEAGGGFWTTLGAGIASFFGGGKKDLIGDFERFSKIDASGLSAVSEGVGKMSSTLQGFDGSGLETAGASIEEFVDYLNDGEAETLKVVGPALSSLGSGLVALASVQSVPNLKGISDSIIGFANSGIQTTIPVMVPILDSFSTSLTTLSLASTAISATFTPITTGFVTMSTLSAGIDMTTQAIIRMTSALTELAGVNVATLKSIPWAQMTNFGKVPGGSVVLAKSANNNFTIEKNTAKNIETSTKKIESTDKQIGELVRINKNLQALLAVLSDSSTAAFQLNIDGRAVTNMIDKRKADRLGQNKTETSDIRLKQNIQLIGKSESGINIYTFEYIEKVGIEGTYQGVMAQELIGTEYESALVFDGEYYKVDYTTLDVDFIRID